MKKYIILLFILQICSLSYGQTRGKTGHMSEQADTTKRDSLKKDSIKKAARSTIKPYAQVISKDFITKKGLFTVHQNKDTLYFEIPDSILGRDIEVINRLEKAPGGTGIYAGEELDEKTIHFEKRAADSTIQIRYDLVISEADSSSSIYKAVQRSDEAPVAMSFPIKAYGKDHHSYVIEVGTYLKTGQSLFNAGMFKEGSRLAGFMDPKGAKDVFLESIHAYPINVEMSISKNGVSNGRGNEYSPGLPQEFPLTLVTHTSFIELPEQPMQQRIVDPRVGFFADQVWHYGDDQQKVEDRRFIHRWRLEPKDEDLAKWKHGELVEPRKPIVIYIDPATPKQWRPYLIQGINDWQKAFEQAGFKNAIMGKEWPENDTTLHMDDARYSFINYFPSEIPNAYGPNVHDPRSGEIIQTHIGWYHNVMQLVHDWYMIQCGATDPKARHAKFDDELMGQLIRFVSSHEVGHTLGLQHNWGASSQTPVDSLRSIHYLKLHNHTSSIMDYARFDYVAQPEDKIPENLLFPHIGEYDRWAIEWGYKNSFAATSEKDKRIMHKLTTDSLSKNSRLWWLGAQNSGSKPNPDPRIQNEDLGDDAAKASTYGIKNLKRILPNLPEWTSVDDGEYENLDELYKELKNQYTRYMQHVMKNIGGTWMTTLSEDQKGPVYAPVSKALQTEAVAFFNKELFTTPYWLLDPKVTSKVTEPLQPDFVEDTQVQVLNKLLDIGKIDRLLANERKFGKEAYPLTEYIAAIHNGIWTELKTGKAIDPYRRDLQKSYVASLQSIILSTQTDQTESDAFSLLREDILQLQKEINAAILKEQDPLSKYHLEDLQVRIKKTLEANPVIQ